MLVERFAATVHLRRSTKPSSAAVPRPIDAENWYDSRDINEAILGHLTSYRDRAAFASTCKSMREAEGFIRNEPPERRAAQFLDKTLGRARIKGIDLAQMPESAASIPLSSLSEIAKDAAWGHRERILNKVDLSFVFRDQIRHVMKFKVDQFTAFREIAPSIARMRAKDFAKILVLAEFISKKNYRPAGGLGALLEHPQNLTNIRFAQILKSVHKIPGLRKQVYLNLLARHRELTIDQRGKLLKNCNDLSDEDSSLARAACVSLQSQRPSLSASEEKLLAKSVVDDPSLHFALPYVNHEELALAVPRCMLFALTEDVKKIIPLGPFLPDTHIDHFLEHSNYWRSDRTRMDMYELAASAKQPMPQERFKHLMRRLYEANDWERISALSTLLPHFVSGNAEQHKSLIGLFHQSLHRLPFRPNGSISAEYMRWIKSAASSINKANDENLKLFVDAFKALPPRHWNREMFEAYARSLTATDSLNHDLQALEDVKLIMTQQLRADFLLSDEHYPLIQFMNESEKQRIMQRHTTSGTKAPLGKDFEHFTEEQQQNYLANATSISKNPSPTALQRLDHAAATVSTASDDVWRRSMTGS